MVNSDELIISLKYILIKKDLQSINKILVCKKEGAIITKVMYGAIFKFILKNAKQWPYTLTAKQGDILFEIDFKDSLAILDFSTQF